MLTVLSGQPSQEGHRVAGPPFSMWQLLHKVNSFGGNYLSPSLYHLGIHIYATTIKTQRLEFEKERASGEEHEKE